MKVTRIRSNEEINKDFAGIVGEGYATGFLAHQSDIIYLTPEFYARFGAALKEMESDAEIIVLRDMILDDLGQPADVEIGWDYAHLQLFIAEFICLLTGEKTFISAGERALERLEKVVGFRTLSYNSWLGFVAMHLYRLVYPLPLPEKPEKGVETRK